MTCFEVTPKPNFNLFILIKHLLNLTIIIYPSQNNNEKSHLNNLFEKVTF